MINKKNRDKYYTIYGVNNCINFLRCKKRFECVNILINKQGNAVKNNTLINLIDRSDFSISFLDDKQYKSKFQFKHDQGIIIEFEGQLIKSLMNEIENFKNETCLIVCDQINDPQNLGQILRTCECAGINGVILPKHSSVHITNSVIQVSQGAIFHLNIFIETNLINTIKFLKSNDFWVIGIENSINAKNWYEMDYKGKIAIVLGSEGKGIRPLVKRSCDFLATIPMRGEISSLNVSAALSAIIFERQRQLQSSK